MVLKVILGGGHKLHGGKLEAVDVLANLRLV